MFSAAGHREKGTGFLQVDYTNRLRAEGMPARDAILEANPRAPAGPFLMTTPFPSSPG